VVRRLFTQVGTQVVLLQLLGLLLREDLLEQVEVLILEHIEEVFEQQQDFLSQGIVASLVLEIIHEALLVNPVSIKQSLHIILVVLDRQVLKLLENACDIELARGAIVVLFNVFEQESNPLQVVLELELCSKIGDTLTRADLSILHPRQVVGVLHSLHLRNAKPIRSSCITSTQNVEEDQKLVVV